MRCVARVTCLVHAIVRLRKEKVAVLSAKTIDFECFKQLDISSI